MGNYNRVRKSLYSQVFNIILGDIMNIHKTKRNLLQLGRARNKRLSLDDMVGKYKAIEPINCVELKHKLK